MINYVTKLAEALKYYNVEYLIIGKGAAILYGYPGTTQDIDIFPKKQENNCKRLIEALKHLRFAMDEALEKAIMEGKDFIQIRGGPFPLDIIFAPDGIESYEKACKRSSFVDNKYPCASMNDIIASKRAAKRQRDMEELYRLELFLKEL